MSGPLLECVPNVSEGRRADLVERLARAARSRPGARLLDLSSDRDHDRTVLTLAGTPDALVAALLALFEVALAEIDLSARAGDADPGVHPCMGAVDVVPFVPLGDAPMALAVATAERLGREVAERFDRREGGSPGGLPNFSGDPLTPEAADQWAKEPVPVLGPNPTPEEEAQRKRSTSSIRNPGAVRPGHFMGR
jgi:hypothetical protein